jgi:pimeloyl-ACP methyl ester carboxylesterase
MPTDDPRQLVYLPGIAGHPQLSPTMQAVAAANWEVVVPDIVGFNGAPGFVPPDHFLDWITIYWDAIDATGAVPCPVVGASVGGMMAAELAALRPEAVTRLVLLSPFGICDEADPGLDPFAVPPDERPSHLFAKGVPDVHADRFADRGEEEAPVARYICDMAAASIYWPFGDHGIAKRLHRITSPRLVLFGGLDELVPPSIANRWGDGEVIAGAGHLMEWDTPEIVSTRLLEFLT